MRLFMSYLGVFGLMVGLAACGPMTSLHITSEPKTNQMPIASRVVDASSAPDRPLSVNFNQLTVVTNPCGIFGSEIKFGVNSDLLDVSCTPDDRTAISN